MAKIFETKESSFYKSQSNRPDRVISEKDAARLKHSLIQGIGTPRTSSSTEQGDRKRENFPTTDQGVRAFSARREYKAEIPPLHMETARNFCLLQETQGHTL